MSNGRYILDGKTTVPCDDLIKWATWFEKADRHVAVDVVGDSKVSTVFLGLDHAYGHSAPLLFETLVFDGPLADEGDRWTTWDEAEKGHAEFVARVKLASSSDKQ